LLHLESQDLDQQKREELKKIFPEIFEDSKINFKKLKTILGEEVEEKSEHYSFNWSGKRECYKTIKAKTNATLKIDSDSEIPDGENVFIEGDNLEVLKLLQNAYHKKVKMIYIDPPYNKDKDFVYKDTWGDTIQNYLMQTDQLRDEGYTTTKSNSSGRRHTNWLNMIYPRLWLSRNLLKDDGVIFVSIDDDEVHNLRKVMDEIYGEENFINNVVWEKKYTISNDAKWFSDNHDHILIYAKNKDIWRPRLLERTEEMNNRYSNPDSHAKGVWKATPLHAKSGSDKNDAFTFTFKNGVVWTPPSGTYPRFSKETFIEYDNNDEIWFGKDGKAVPSRKTFLCDLKNNGIVPKTIWQHNEVGHNHEGREELKKLFDNHVYFDTPKPVNLLKRMLHLATSDDDIILDFFAGSGTTAHAVMDLNQEDGGKRKYILVQLPEATDEKSEAYKAGYKKISDITKERIKRVIKKLDYKEGFKSFYLDNSNFQIFKEIKKRPNESMESIEQMLKMSIFHENILTQGAKALDLVIEVGLKNGFTLSAKREEMQSENFNFIKLSEEESVLYFCFDKEISNKIVYALPKNARLICYEKALDDSTKLNLRLNLDLETL
jgi:adenine-specific DNA-methyltransferase